jgi:ketosteroid isomerase-like protein
MSAENVQVLRDGYAAFARQDVPAVMAAFDPGIEWNTPVSLPFGGRSTAMRA